MDENRAVIGFGALAQDKRLNIVRLLVEAGAAGVAAGDIAEAVGISPSNLSFHLKELEHAGLVRQRREARSIIYDANHDGLRDLTVFLMNDCCGGKLEVRNLSAGSASEPQETANAASNVIIYHNPDCGTSRNTLGLIRNAGVEPHIVEYLKSPPSRTLLKELLARAGLSVRAALREKGTPHKELGLGDMSLSDEALLDAMMAHPILINGRSS